MNTPMKRPWLWLGALILMGSQWHCLERAERRCEVQASCDGAARPSVCFQGKCVLKVCEPGKRQSCFEATCANGTCPPSVRDTGACASGFQLCLDNGSRWSDCYATVSPTKESCDGIDNDCNGKIDEALSCRCRVGETRSCYTGHAKSQTDGDKTFCSKGIQRCVKENQWGSCIGQRRPQDIPLDAIARCEIADVDCDGTPDALACNCPKEGETRPCYPGPQETKDKGICQSGTQTCRRAGEGALRWSPCSGYQLPQIEENNDCNGKDDDCDGIVDNATGQPLPLYQACKDVSCGVQLCKDKQWGQCQKQELCGNQQDDNCDGKTDEQPCSE